MMPPMFGDITPTSVAYQCVIAGCRPAEMPVVLAASEAIAGTRFQPAGHRHHDRHRLRGALRARPDRAPSSASMPAPTAWGRATGSTPASAAPCSSASATSAARARRPATWRPWASPASTRCLLRRARRRPLPDPPRAPRPRRGCQRDHGDGHLGHRRGAAGRRRGRHARGDPLADRRRHARRDRDVEHPAARTSAASRSSCCRSRWPRRSSATTAGTSRRVQRYVFEQGEGVARAPKPSIPSSPAAPATR